MNPADDVSREPLATLIARTRAELSAEFSEECKWFAADRPGGVDVMGGILASTGAPIVRASLASPFGVAIVCQPRLHDRDVQIFSFDEFDAHRPFTLRMSLDRLAKNDDRAIESALDMPGRSWARPVLETLVRMIRANRSDNTFEHLPGLNFAMVDCVPDNSSSIASLQIATIAAVSCCLGDLLDAGSIELSEETKLTGRSNGSVALLEAAKQRTLNWPSGIRLLALDSRAVVAPAVNVAVSTVRIRAKRAHEIILNQMHQIGRAAGRELIADPMRGSLVHLNPDDYKQYFRVSLPVDEQHAADHFVLEPKRVREFARSIEAAAKAPPKTREAGKWLDRAGHLMYASNHSYIHDAMIGSPECNLLVDLIHAREKAGIYGARLAGNGASEGIVVVLADEGQKVDGAIGEVLAEYSTRTGNIASVIPVQTT